MPAPRLLHRQYENGVLMEVVEEDGMRSLYFSGRHLQSRQNLMNKSLLLLPYNQYMMTFPLVRLDTPEQVLMIGVGGGSIAHYLQRHFPTCHIDAVDISSAILSVARKFFDLCENDMLHIYCQDGDTFLRQNQTRYDLILLDAFDDQGMAPNLYAAPFFTLARERLSENGILCCNLWSNHGATRRRVFHQLRESFTETLFLPVPERGNTVSLSGKFAVSWRESCSNYNRLLQLSDRFELDFVAMAAVAERHNGSKVVCWRRLLHG